MGNLIEDLNQLNLVQVLFPMQYSQHTELLVVVEGLLLDGKLQRQNKENHVAVTVNYHHVLVKPNVL
jgi:hypothetical protein